MSRIGLRIVTIAAAAGGFATAFVALSPTAAADPAAPVIPAMPGINVVQELANAPAMASQLLQNAATLLKPAAATPATPPASVPTATASFNLPQPPVSAPMTSAVGTVPAAPLNAPATSSSGSLPLLSQLGLPSNLAGLNGLPLPNVAAPAAPVAPAAPGETALPPSLNPFSALP